METKKENFGIAKNGNKISKFILKNKYGLEVEISDFGALLLALHIADKKGGQQDILLGYDTLEEYYNNDCGFGAYIGRNCNRIQGANVTLDGVNYSLDKNDGENNLHSGYHRSHYQVYEAVTGESREGTYVQLERMSPHLEQGFPGNLMQKIRYTLTESNQLMIRYEMKSDKTTVVNPTNHSYFNLSGHNSGNVLSHEMEIYAEAFLPTDEQLIPTGEIAPVENTPMDFRYKKTIGADIQADYQPLRFAGGYDHNYVFENDRCLKKMAKLYSPATGIYMNVFSDMCGMQVYSGNFLEGVKGKKGAVYQRNAGICFETQFYPNACKEPGFPSSVLVEGETFRSCTIYEFGIE